MAKFIVIVFVIVLLLKVIHEMIVHYVLTHQVPIHILIPIWYQTYLAILYDYVDTLDSEVIEFNVGILKPE